MSPEEQFLNEMSSGFFICHDLNPAEGIDNIHVLCLSRPRWFGRFNPAPAPDEPWFTVIENFDNATYDQMKDNFDDACAFLESGGYISGYNFTF